MKLWNEFAITIIAVLVVTVGAIMLAAPGVHRLPLPLFQFPRRKDIAGVSHAAFPAVGGTRVKSGLEEAGVNLQRSVKFNGLVMGTH